MNEILFEVFIYLGAAVVAVPISKQLGLGSVLGYLIAGIVIGPVAGWVGDEAEKIQHVAEFGVVMMLFLVGLELEPEKLWELRHKLIGLGGLQVGLTTALFFGAGILFGLPWTIALSVGLILALSSTAIVLQTLNEKGLMSGSGGQASFSVLLFQDIAVIPMLALLPLLVIPELVTQGGEAGHGGSLIEGYAAWAKGLITILAIAAIVLSGKYLIKPIFRFIARPKLREMFTAFALFLVVGIAALMTLIGLSPALGTFLAGVVLANSEYRHELESNIDPFKGLLLGLFFITVGAGIDFELLFAEFGVILGLTLGVIFIKFAILYLLGALFKIRGAARWLFALSLAQAGEFGFVLLSFSVQNGVLPTVLADQLLLVVAISMLLTPLLFILFDRFILPKYSKSDEIEDEPIDVQSSIIIAGHGRFGQIVNRILEHSGYKPIVIDIDIETIDGITKFGYKTYFGDASRPELLESAGLENAKLLIIAIDDPTRAVEIASYASRNFPNVAILARSFDRPHTYDLYQAGAKGGIVRETFDSAVRLGKYALEALGHEAELAEKVTQLFFERDRQTVFEAAEFYDPEAPRFSNKEMIEKVRQMDGETATQIRSLLE